MGADFSMPSLKKRAKEACRRPWLRLRGVPDERLLHPGRLVATVVQTVTQESTPLVSPDDELERYTRAQSPSLLTINSAARLSPSGSPAGVALGIPAEHILDESPSGFDGPVTPLNFSRPTATCTVEISASTSAHTNNESGDRSNPFKGSSLGHSRGSNSTLTPAARPLAHRSQTDPTPASRVAANPSGADERDAARREDDPDAITPAPPLDTKPSASEQVVDMQEMLDNGGACYFCRLDFEVLRTVGQEVFREHKAYLPCGHFFGHRCLFNWITNRGQPERRIRCPLDCISLHHNCEHLTMPARMKPTRTYRKASTDIIPWAYGFCELPFGRRLCKRIERIHRREERSEDEKSMLQKALEVLYGQRFPFAGKMRTPWTKKREDAEEGLRREQAIWWAKMWQAIWKIRATILEE
ncbi:zinc finger, ring fyve phd-type [Trichoderma arundinaceum]|uniref:Zinc finger, ring fyve phd-type n=1 Tax=Trichoderma arundinaceum TaxID=490622 RepID=A0A395NZR0_TRIAR|nr:zinc finger, ring fyve phd-type [Trichoderma arundinaceum]